MSCVWQVHRVPSEPTVVLNKHVKTGTHRPRAVASGFHLVLKSIFNFWCLISMPLMSGLRPPSPVGAPRSQIETMGRTILLLPLLEQSDPTLVPLLILVLFFLNPSSRPTFLHCHFILSGAVLYFLGGLSLWSILSTSGKLNYPVALCFYVLFFISTV